MTYGRAHYLPPTNVAAETLRAYLLSHPARCLPRFYSAHPTQRTDDGLSSENQGTLEQEKNSSFSQRARQRLANREFFTSLLSSAATKRDAKAYISRLKNPAKSTGEQKPATRDPQSQVEAGELFGRTRASEASPVFTQFANEQEREQATEEQELLHVALVKISDVSIMADNLVKGIAQTLSSLSRLSMAPCVVLEEPLQDDPQASRRQLTLATNRLATAIDSVHESGARILDNVLSLGPDGRPQVFLRKLLTRPLRRGRIPIILPIAYSAEQSRAVSIGADEAALALTRELAGVPVKPQVGEQQGYKNISLDRIIVVDRIGPIPSTKALDKRHVFVNLEQEYSALQEELRSSTDDAVSQKHASNLKMFKEALRLLPASSSALLTTPLEAANSARLADDGVSSVGTRRQKNPLIHNLLTDKPAYSSSLPAGRLGQDASAMPLITSTVVKRGMPVTMLPNPEAQTWTASSRPRLQLTDPRIDLDRLTYLIDDSFNRKLDVEAYLERVNDRIAGVIIAGEYEGGAILTWETPPGCSDSDTDRLVPYLDKFAVLKKSQGAGGVADIVFNAMVRTCFPNGVCWRSRKDNPVNKWYFERSRGTWKIPGTNWTMFWTTPGILVSEGNKSQTFLDYEGVCRTVKPTWADGKRIAD
ncbi:Amino-acid acetyltransferase, mitochondrial [Cladophialophora carrionii]|uniref:Amino-acid acetyltransferase, mitochondrial n=1 Tax=Cladophialophora carrionii TaxID=86049 RepID=A0A1C1CSI9_9EURO|nr:Amino-acid acetyltransferase, mitochondrial [Cladophialophora carrionii]